MKHSLPLKIKKAKLLIQNLTSHHLHLQQRKIKMRRHLLNQKKIKKILNRIFKIYNKLSISKSKSMIKMNKKWYNNWINIRKKQVKITIHFKVMKTFEFHHLLQRRNLIKRKSPKHLKVNHYNRIFMSKHRTLIKK